MVAKATIFPYVSPENFSSEPGPRRHLLCKSHLTSKAIFGVRQSTACLVARPLRPGVPPYLQVLLGTDSRKRPLEVRAEACLHLMDGSEEMSGTFLPCGGSEATPLPHIPS